MADLTTLDPTQPADNTQESTMPGFVRALTADLLGWCDVEHNRTGTHKRFYGADTGAVNALAITITHVLTAYDTGMEFIVIPANTNTGAVTLAVTASGATALGAKSVKKGGTTALVAGDVVAGIPIHVVYDGTYFQLVSSLGNTAVQSSGGLVLIANDESLGIPTPASTYATLKTLSTGTTAFTKVLIEADVLIINNGNNPQTYFFRFYDNTAASELIVGTAYISGQAGTGEQFMQHLSFITTWASAHSILLQSKCDTNNADFQVQAYPFRIWGIK